MLETSTCNYDYVLFILTLTGESLQIRDYLKKIYIYNTRSEKNTVFDSSVVITVKWNNVPRGSFRSSFGLGPVSTLFCKSAFKFDRQAQSFTFFIGGSARAIQGLTRTEANYNSAIEILHKRFGKPQNIRELKNDDDDDPEVSYSVMRKRDQ